MASTGRTALIVYRGRVADRNARGMRGASAMGAALASASGTETTEIGTPEPPLGGDWAAELEAARPGLLNLQREVDGAFAAGRRPVTAMGRCAAGLGILPAVVRARPDAAIVWFDAHGDLNTPEHTASGYLGGMVLTGAAGLWKTGLGDGLDLSNIVLVGARDLDAIEETLIERHGIRTVAPGPDLPQRLQQALDGRPAYVHLDCDVLDPGIVPLEYGTDGGVSLPELSAACSVIADGEVIGLEIAEFEDSWPDGTPGEASRIAGAVAPLL